MILGYAGKFLDIDLSTQAIKETKFSDEILKDYMGGRGLATKILWDRLGAKWETVDPLGPENLLLLLTGPLTGFFPGGRTCVSGKSPQSNGVVGSTLSGEFGVELRCAGYDGIIVTGESEKPVYLFLKDSDVELRNASDVWGKDGKQTVSALTKECRGLLEDALSKVWRMEGTGNVVRWSSRRKQGANSGCRLQMGARCRLWRLWRGYGFQKAESSSCKGHRTLA